MMGIPRLHRAILAACLLSACSALFAQTAPSGNQERVKQCWTEGAAFYQAGESLRAIARWEEAVRLDPANMPIRDKIAEAQAGLVEAPVLRVVDGSTVDVTWEGKETRVRLIGVSAPGPEASDFLSKLLTGHTVFVKLGQGTNHSDADGRLLAYLHLSPEGMFVNLEMVRQGFGRAETTVPFEYLAVFKAVEQQARQAAAGLWAGEDAAPVRWPISLGAYRVITTDPPAYLTQGTTMVPFRAVLEWMGAEVRYNDGVITATLGDRNLQLRAETRDAEVDGQRLQLTVPATVREDTTFVPLRFLCEGLGAEVRWDETAQRVYLHQVDKFAYVDIDCTDSLGLRDHGWVGGSADPGFNWPPPPRSDDYDETAPEAQPAAGLEMPALEAQPAVGGEEPAPEGEPAAGSDIPAPNVVPAVGASGGGGGTVYITNTGTKYHLAGCRYLRQSRIAISLNDARAQGYTACSVCYGRQVADDPPPVGNYGGDVNVRGYYRKDGTYVRPHTRRRPRR